MGVTNFAVLLLLAKAPRRKPGSGRGLAKAPRRKESGGELGEPMKEGAIRVGEYGSDGLLNDEKEISLAAHPIPLPPQSCATAP
ncbi:hypothetical protein VN12_00605 [Pirellula sp. SH-Sr6A]|nr:hypothetical protein VN12_00605 [Pirellula sp. SH-Sr6A]